MDLELNVYLPFLSPLPITDDETKKFQIAIEDFCNLSGKLTLASHIVDELVPEIWILEPSSSEEDQANKYLETLSSVKDLARPSPRSSSIVKISTKVSVNYDYIEGYDPGGNVTRYEGETAEQLYSLTIGSELLDYIHRLIVAANISHVGLLPSDKGVLVSKNGINEIESTSNVQSLAWAKEYALSLGWPSIKTLSISDAWDWISTQKGFIEGFGASPTGRSLNALTHLLRPVNSIDEGTELFWSLVGLEALYTKGNSGLQQQVKEKSQTLLGPQDSHKKEIGRMYDFRSRFVHGDLDFFGAHPSEETIEKQEKHRRNLVDSVNLAQSMLVATLQTLIVRGWDEPDFYYQVKAGPE